METFGEKISAEACSDKEIAGLLRKRAKLEAGRNGLSLCIARDGPESCCWRVLKA